MSEALELFEEGTRWTDRIARLMFPILVDHAKAGSTITYGEMRAQLQRRFAEHHVHASMYGHPAGKVGNICIALGSEWAAPIPPLNAIIVNGKTGLPGDGADYYLSKFVKGRDRKRLSDHERRAMAEETIEAVFNFRRVDALASALGINGGRIAHQPLTNPIVVPPIRKPRGGESDAHKSLKRWVAQHPSAFKEFGRFAKGEEEKFISSGDEIDVFFSNGHLCLGVEVKASGASEGELCRGVFQCVKYRAVLRAMLKAEAKVPAAVSLLVLEEKPGRVVRSLAQRLDVPVMVVDRK